MSLCEKYRPQVFEDVLGQARAVADLKALLKNGAAHAVLLTGPSGTGKTTLARMVGAAINCENLHSSGSPCGACEHCVDRAPWYYLEWPACVQGGKEAALHLEECARHGAWLDETLVVFVDEVHGCSRQAQDVFLARLEAPGRSAFIFATTDPDALAPAFRSRCHQIELRVLTEAELIDLGRGICAGENIAAQPDALRLLAAAARGSARDLVRLIERFGASGPLSVSAVTRGLRVEWPEPALRVLLALTRRDLAAAAQLVKDWSASPAQKAQRLHDMLVHVAHVGFTPERAHPGATVEVLLSPPDLVAELVAALSDSRGGVGVPPLAYVLSLADHWAQRAPTLREPSDLDRELLRMAHGLSPTDASLAPLPALPPLLPAPRRACRAKAAVAESVRPPRQTARAAYLTKLDARRVYHAASCCRRRTAFGSMRAFIFATGGLA